MSIIYVLSIIMLLVAFILLKKTEKRVNILKAILISIVLFLCYNVVIAYINDLVNVKSTLKILSIENLVASLIIFINILRNREIQKYERASLKDIIAIMIIAIAVSILGYLYFGYPIKLKYFMTDAANHYAYARFFYENSELLASGVKPRSLYKCWNSFKGS